MKSQSGNAKSIFLNAAELATAEQRRAYVAEQCGDDQLLRQEVEQLLLHSEKDEAFLKDGPAEPAVTAPPLSPAEIPSSIIGRYKVLEPIGDGGMGTVYMAEQQHPVRRLVALKVIKPGMDSRSVLARFEAERQALAMMDHPCIARVFDGGTTERGHPWFAMELVRGLPLMQYCDQRHMPVSQRLE